MEKDKSIVEKILENLIEIISCRIDVLNDNAIEKDRMLFSTCLNDIEKQELTKSEIKKMQSKLVECNSEIAGYISIYLNPEANNISDLTYDELKEKLILNFLLNHQEEALAILELYFKEADIDSVNEIFWEDVLNESIFGINKKLTKQFIKNMVLAGRLNTFKSFIELEQVQINKDTDNEIHSILNKIRGKDQTSLELYNFIKEQTNLDPTALKYFKEDVDIYLHSERDAFGDSFSEDEINKAIFELKEKGHDFLELVELGYYRLDKITKQLYNKVEYHIDKEKLLFPFEFYNIYELLKIINSELNKYELTEDDNIKESKKIDTFQTLIPQKEKHAYVLTLLEDLSITVNGKSILTPRKKGALRGVIEALKDKCIIPNKGIHTLCKIVAEEIQLELKSELDASTTSEKYKKEALNYINRNPLH